MPPPIAGYAGQRLPRTRRLVTEAYAYGWRDWPCTATLDMLYSRQFDGGYLHREYESRTGLPILFEPDFSPNPPLPAVAALPGDAAKAEPYRATNSR